MATENAQLGEPSRSGADEGTAFQGREKCGPPCPSGPGTPVGHPVLWGSLYQWGRLLSACHVLRLLYKTFSAW